MSKLSDTVLEIAQSQIGISESPKGSNSGKEVNKYLSAVGLPPGNSWCMAFVYWCYNKAAEQLGIVNPLYKTGSCLQQVKNSAKNKYVNPKVGDVFILDLGKGRGHTGIVTSIDLQGQIINTIEGNSNDDGEREGYEVCRKPGGRRIKSVSAFLRF